MSLVTLLLLALSVANGANSFSANITEATPTTPMSSTTTSNRFSWLLSSNDQNNGPRTLSMLEMASRRKQLLQVARQARLLHLAQMHAKNVDNNDKTRSPPRFRSRPRRRPSSSRKDRVHDLDRRTWRFMFRRFWQWLQSEIGEQVAKKGRENRNKKSQKTNKVVEKRSPKERERIRRNRRLLRETMSKLQDISDQN